MPRSNPRCSASSAASSTTRASPRGARRSRSTCWPARTTSILSNFYERALADQPAAVRRIIEDELLTESGFRENVAEETLRDAPCCRRRRAGHAGDARQPAPAAHRGAARHAPRRADPRRAVRRGQGEPRRAARARSARSHRADAGGAARSGRRHAPRAGPRAPGRRGLHRPGRRRRRRGDLRLLELATREARRGPSRSSRVCRRRRCSATSPPASRASSRTPAAST